MSSREWPAVRYGPDGQTRLCNSPADVPEGWADHPTRVGKPKPVEPPKSSKDKDKKAKGGVRAPAEKPKPQEEDVDFGITREEAIQFLRENGHEISDDISDEDLEAIFEKIDL